MTRAERRELQEKQRAAKKGKEAAPAADGAGGKGKAKAGVNAAKATSQNVSPAGAPSKDAPRDGPGAQGPDGPRGLRIFSHFGSQKSPSSGKASSVEYPIHPAIIRLGLQFSEFKITGANARCIATLTALKTVSQFIVSIGLKSLINVETQVIQDYSTPVNTTLSRHLEKHLSPQITYLVSARPMAVTMGNAIRQLKKDISECDIDLPDENVSGPLTFDNVHLLILVQAKDLLCQKIDTYIRDRIVFADQVIVDTAVQKMKDGDTILTYARCVDFIRTVSWLLADSTNFTSSSVVQKILLGAHEEGKNISVVAVDSRPLLEGE